MPDSLSQQRIHSPAANHFSALLFDWDGTLYDSESAGYSAFVRTFEFLGIEFNREIYAEIYTPNWYQMYTALGVPGERWEEADRVWLDHFAHQPIRMIEGARETIEALRKRNYRLGVVTSGTRSRVERELEFLGLTSVFEVVICNEDTVNKKPHPEGLVKAIASLGSSPSECSYVGDTPEDIQMGRRAGVFTVGVLGPYPTARHLASAAPDVFLDSIGELLKHF